MTPARRVDSNHAEIKRALRAAGWTVIDTHEAGKGMCDLIAVRDDGRAFLIEVKAQPEVTEAEVRFMIGLVNPVYRIASSVEQAIEIVRGGE